MISGRILVEAFVTTNPMLHIYQGNENKGNYAKIIIQIECGITNHAIRQYSRWKHIIK